MHFILLMSIAASCILELGLSLINDSSKGCSGGGRDGGRWHHTAYGGSSSCPHRRTLLLRRKTKRLTQSASSTTVVAFSAAVIGKPTATVLRRRKCSYVADTGHYPPTSESIDSSRRIRDGKSLFSKSSWMLLSTSTLGRANAARCSSSRLAARGFIDTHSDGDDDFLRRKDGGRIVDPTTQSKAPQRQRRGTRPFMKTGASPNSDDASRIPRLRQHGGGGVAGRGTAAAAASAAAASATGAAGVKTGEGIDRNDPLVKAWNSARVLNPSRDEFPLGRVQQQRKQRQGHRRREDFGDGEEFSIPASRIRAGVRENGRQDASGRGGGRGRDRGRKTMPVGVYKGDDKVPWYIKEVQVSLGRCTGCTIRQRMNSPYLESEQILVICCGFHPPNPWVSTKTECSSSPKKCYPR